MNRMAVLQWRVDATLLLRMCQAASRVQSLCLFCCSLYMPVSDSEPSYTKTQWQSLTVWATVCKPEVFMQWVADLKGATCFCHLNFLMPLLYADCVRSNTHVFAHHDAD